MTSKHTFGIIHIIRDGDDMIIELTFKYVWITKLKHTGILKEESKDDYLKQMKKLINKN